MNELQDKIQNLLQPEKNQKWNVTCALHLSKQPPQSTETKELFIFNFDDAPEKCYLMIKDSILEADRDMAVIIDKIRLYQLRQTITVTV